VAWEIAGLAEHAEADLSAVKTPVLRAALQKTLQVFRHGSQPARRTYDPRGKLLKELWSGARLYPIAPAPDPRLLLSEMSGEVRGVVRALSAELERRKVRVPPLPPE
jgi:hypothetical protein